MRKLRVMFLVLLSFHHGIAQDAGLVTPIPPSPEVLSLFKFSTLPVSKSTGIPSISIPLYTIQCKRTSIPIQLDYHAGGIRITDVPSSVGLGWAIQSGGILTQSIRGLDDYQFQYGRIYKKNNVLSPTACDVKSAIEGLADPEP